MKHQWIPLGLLVVLSANLAHAFSLSDHEAITTQAIRELRACVPNGALSSAKARNLISGDLDEDINVVVKWWRYSHYFNPEKKLNTRREDSSVRMRVLFANLRAMALEGSSEADREELIGHILHHFQDVSSPPHVLPVQHWLTDGFETFEEGIVPAPTGADLDCESLREASVIDPMSLFVETARATLKNAHGWLPVYRNNSPIQIPWSFFWQEDSGNGIGNYGVLGNHFGDESIRTRSSHYEVDRSVYQKVKRQQLRLAIQSTKRALLWMIDRGYLL